MSKPISSSALKLLRRSPLHYWHEYLNPNYKRKDPTSAMLMGTALHAWIYEEKKVWSLKPTSKKNSNAGKKEHADFEASLPKGGVGLTALEIEKVKGMKKSIWACEDASALLTSKNRLTEKTITWTDEQTNVECKARLDLLLLDGLGALIVDLKTCQNASEKDFSNAIKRGQYHIQAAFYIRAVKMHFPEIRRKHIKFIWIAVENSPPHGVAIYELGDLTFYKGEDDCDEALRTYADCCRTNSWPGYKTRDESGNRKKIELARWALR